MNKETAQFLTSPEGQALLSEAMTSEKSSFNLASYLRSKTTPEFAAAISTMLELRKKGEKKFRKASEMLFTRSGLEQASAEDISKYRAQRFIDSGITKIADLCCGIAGDSISYSQRMEVIGVDLDPARLILARHNTEVYNTSKAFKTIEADITTVDLKELGIDAFFIDPARRTSTGKRLFDPESWSPKLSTIRSILENTTPNAGIKCAPGIDHGDIPKDADAEFISYNGELRECVLWFGNLRRGISKQATLLPAGEVLHGENPYIATENIKEYIYEPDSAVMRAGLVELLGSMIGATKISETICFLSSNEYKTTPFAKCFRVVSYADYKEKNLKKKLKELDCGSLNIIKRGIGVDIPTLQKKLKLKGKRHLTLILTRSFEQKISILAEHIPTSGS